MTNNKMNFLMLIVAILTLLVTAIGVFISLSDSGVIPEDRPEINVGDIDGPVMSGEFIVGNSNIGDNNTEINYNITNNNVSISQSTDTSKPDTEFTPIALPNYTNSIGMEFLQIPSGSFSMGDNEQYIYYSWDQSYHYYASPEHDVEFKKPFYLGSCEVTQKQWCELMDYNPSTFKGDDLPVDNVTLSEVQDFIEKLNQKERTDKYRLPSEAEWEYACRANTTGDYYFDTDVSQLDDYEWYVKNSGYEIHPVHQKKPNPWGLCDMLGNVMEMTLDRWHENYEEQWGGDHPPINGSAWGIAEGIDDFPGDEMVIRGGYWDTDAEYCRSAYRFGWYTGSSFSNIGFRLAMEV